MKWLKGLFGFNSSTSADHGGVAINGDNKAPIFINNHREMFNVKNFSDWSKTSEFELYPFIDVEARRQLIEELRELLKQPKRCARIVGLPGLGKTRTSFEIFNGDILLQGHVVYIDALNISNITSVFSEWISSGLRKVVVIDNCAVQLHKQLQKEISRTDSQISILTLDYNLERISNTREYHLKPFNNQEIRGMLETVYRTKIPDLDRIADFAQGFPQMAVFIAEARLIEDPNIGKLTDDDIADKLLWGRLQTKNDKDEKILKSCALFDSFGVEKEAESDLRFIANNILGLKNNEFNDVFECIQRFTVRGIIDRRGRYAQIVPKPLAIRLAAQWWERTCDQDQNSLIDSLPETLIESFCKQIEKLDSLPKVKELTASICGCQGPFGQAEVILSIRGSRLFRSIVNVNPDVTNAALTRILKNKSHQELLEINGDIRRNLVWALENLCFHAHLFEEAAWSLLLLASSENESYSNNATGIFTQLFRVRLSGTAAVPQQRLQVLIRAIEKKDENFLSVVLKALEKAISTYGGSRVAGAEYQGIKAPLEEWKPLIWQDIFDYWQSCFDLLLQLTEKEDQISENAKDIIGHSIRGFVQNGRIEMLDKVIHQVITLKGKYWPSALESIKNTMEFDTEKMPQEGVNALSNWLKLLSPDQSSIEEKLKILVVNPPWEHRHDIHGQYIDIAAQKAESFAYEISKDIQSISEHLNLLLIGEQKQSFIFGKALAAKADNVDMVLQKAIALLPYIKYPNTNFVRGLLSGVYLKSVECWNTYIEAFAETPELIQFYPEFICTGIIEQDHLLVLLDLIRKNQLTTREAIYLSYGSVTDHLHTNDLSTFCLELAKIEPNGNWVALDIIFMYCYGDDDKFQATKDTLKSIVTSVCLNNRFRGGHQDMHHWEEVIKKLSKTEGLDFARAICMQIIAAADDKLDHNDIWNSIKPTLLEIMSIYGKELWPIFADAIILADPIKRYWLQCLLERENSFSNLKESVLSVLPLELIIEWCKEYPDIGPSFVARTINIFEKTEGDEKKPSKIFIVLLENFGDLDSVRNDLSANMNSGGWMGSLVPYLESDKSVLVPLLTHSNHHVRNWVRDYIAYLDKSIAYELSRDDEHSLGIYN